MARVDRKVSPENSVTPGETFFSWTNPDQSPDKGPVTFRLTPCSTMSDAVADASSIAASLLKRRLDAQLHRWIEHGVADLRKCGTLVAAGARVCPVLANNLVEYIVETHEPRAMLEDLLRYCPASLFFKCEPGWLRIAPEDVVNAALRHLEDVEHTTLAAVLGAEGTARAFNLFLNHDNFAGCEAILERTHGRLPYDVHHVERAATGLLEAMGFMPGGLDEESLSDEEPDRHRLQWFLCGDGATLREDLIPLLPQLLLQDAPCAEACEPADKYSALGLATEPWAPVYFLQTLLTICGPHCGAALTPVLTARLLALEGQELESKAVFDKVALLRQTVGMVVALAVAEEVHA